MHEWALAEAIVGAVKTAAEGKGRVEEVCVVLGELQNVDPRILAMALRELSRGAKLGEVTYKFEVERTEFMCNNCGHRWRLSEIDVNEEEREAIHFFPELAHSFIRCPACGSPDFGVVKGRGVWIKYIKLARG